MAIRLFFGLFFLAVGCFCLATWGRRIWRGFVDSLRHMPHTSPTERRIILLIVAGLILIAVARALVLAWGQLMLRA